MLEGFYLNSAFLEILDLLADHLVLGTDQVEKMHVLLLGKRLSSQVYFEEVGFNFLTYQNGSHLRYPSFAVPQDFPSLQVVFYPDLLHHQLLPKHVPNFLLSLGHLLNCPEDLPVLI